MDRPHVFLAPRTLSVFLIERRVVWIAATLNPGALLSLRGVLSSVSDDCVARTVYVDFVPEV